jgi:hypothetical protein
MRQERTVQATIFEVFAQHEIGCVLIPGEVARESGMMSPANPI